MSTTETDEPRPESAMRRVESSERVETVLAKPVDGQEHKLENGHGHRHDFEAAAAVPWRAGKREKVIIGTMAVLNIIIALDATVLVPALPTLSKLLGGTALETFWTGTSYLLTNSVFLLLLGAVSDVMGRQSVLLFALIMFTAGTLVCCTATGFHQLLLGRTIQGVGGGGIYTMSAIIPTDIIPLRQRPKYQAMIMAAFGLGTIFGPLIGGAIAEHADWRWLFFINFPFCAFGLAIVPWSFRHVKRKDKVGFWQGVRAIDWLGGILFIAGISSLLLGLTWGGIQYDWDQFETWLPIVLGVVMISISVVYEAYVPKTPFLRLSVFYSPSACLAFLLSTLYGFDLYAFMYYASFQVRAVKFFSPTVTGLYMMAVCLIMVPVGVLSGAIMTKRGSFLWAVHAGFGVYLVGNGLLLYLDQYKNVATYLFILLVSAVAHGLLLLSLNIAVQAISATRNVAYAVSMYAFSRHFGICLGVALGGTVFSNVILDDLRGRDLPEAQVLAVAKHSEAFVEDLIHMADGRIKTLLTDAYVVGFRGVFYLMLVVTAVGFLLSFLIKHHDMNKQLDSDHQLSPVEEKADR